MADSFKNKILGCLAGGLIGDAMGAPVENWHYKQIEEKFGLLQDFNGDGTDDSAIKLILCDAILENNGHVTADEFAASFLKYECKYYDLFYIPVKNMLHKIKSKVSLPVYGGFGNMQSSSSAMAISPMGIINACNPRQAALETFDIAGLIHAGDTTFCRDAACAMAAAVAEAMKPQSTVRSVTDAATAYLHPVSSRVMTDLIREALMKTDELNDYAAFRKWFYENRTQDVMCDSRETVPVALALFALAQGDPQRSILYGVNYGRDADTIGTMAGALAGAFKGAECLPKAWMDKLSATNDQTQLVHKLADVAISKLEEAKQAVAQIEALLQ